MGDKFFATAHELKEKGIPFATATVVRAERPTSSKPGDKAIITADGELSGWIGGSCAQPTVVREALKALADGESRLIRLSPDPDQLVPLDRLIDLPMTCFSGGVLEVFIEPQQPQPRLLIVGNSPVALALAQLAKVMQYDVVAVDADGHNNPDADRNLNDLNEAAKMISPDTFVVVATHGSYDELALEELFKARPLYIGLVASQKRFGAVRDYLHGQGISDEALKILKAPAGLDIQARRSDEIALSIIAEIVQRHRNRHDAPESSAARPGPATTSSEEAGSGVAIDLVCGMEVEIASAKYRHEHEGQMYYFCCAGCKTKFAADPEQYVQQDPPTGQAIDPVCHMTVEIAEAQHMSEHDHKLYYFCSAGCKTSFETDPVRHISAVQV